MEPLTTLAILLLCHKIHSFVIHNPNTLDSFENKVFQLQKTSNSASVCHKGAVR